MRTACCCAIVTRQGTSNPQHHSPLGLIIIFLMDSVITTLSQGKLQKHQAFEAEISAHSNAIVELQENGEGMISESHYASELIRVSYSTNTSCLFN